ncbi:hypothetical protein DFJ77DRAFT_544715 [Powellomyces hirtus]|nr:hypothetical protein DFJ77DRAFT_544715 [Powellomyces hirtus]
MLPDSNLSSRSSTPMPSGMTTPQRTTNARRYRDVDALSQCDSVLTEASTTSTASRWSAAKGFRFRRRTGSIRSTSTTQSTHERLSLLIKHLTRSLSRRNSKSSTSTSTPSSYSSSSLSTPSGTHTPNSILNDPSTPTPYSTTQLRLDDFSIRWGSTNARYGGATTSATTTTTGAAMAHRPAGPRRLQSEDAAAVWADVMKTAHTTKGSAQKAAFHHVLRERDQALLECRRLKSVNSRGSSAAAVPHNPSTDNNAFVDAMRSIQGRIRLAVDELRHCIDGANGNNSDAGQDAIKAAVTRLENLTREFEHALPSPVAKSAEPSTQSNRPTTTTTTPTIGITKPRALAGPRPLVPSPCSQSLSRHSSVHTLSNPVQANRIPTPATNDHETSRATMATTSALSTTTTASAAAATTTTTAHADTENENGLETVPSIAQSDHVDIREGDGEKPRDAVKAMNEQEWTGEEPHKFAEELCGKIDQMFAPSASEEPPVESAESTAPLPPPPCPPPRKRTIKGRDVEAGAGRESTTEGPVPANHQAEISA